MYRNNVLRRSDRHCRDYAAESLIEKVKLALPCNPLGKCGTVNRRRKIYLSGL